MAEKGSIQSLRTAGVKVDKLSPAQREFLDTLSNEEVQTLVRIQERAVSARLPQVGGDDTGVIIY